MLFLNIVCLTVAASYLNRRLHVALRYVLGRWPREDFQLSEQDTGPAFERSDGAMKKWRGCGELRQFETGRGQERPQMVQHVTDDHKPQQTPTVKEVSSMIEG
jgi:hypothetical protein